MQKKSSVFCKARRKRTLACGSAAITLASSILGGHVMAADTTVLPTVTVTGQAASINSALDVQQMADNVVSVVHSDGIGQLPDNNAAEALQRVPGISIERDQGEGRYVRVRGIDPNLNSVNINDTLIPSPEKGTRAVAMDVLPAGMIQSLEVTKTLMPSQDANSIGGTIDVKTLSAFDHSGRFIAASVGGIYDTSTSSTHGEGSFTWSNKFADNKLGIALGLSTGSRKYSTDNIESAVDNPTTTWSGNKLSYFERREYTVNRERSGGFLNLDYRPSEGESYYVRTMLSRFADNEIRQRNSIDFGSSYFSAGQMASGVTSTYELRSREEIDRLGSIVLGMNRKLGAWNLAVSGGYSKASEEDPNYMTVSFAQKGISGIGFDDTSTPELIGNTSNVTNPAGYFGNKIKIYQSMADDHVKNLKFDLDRKLNLLGYDSELKFGAKASRREKTNDLQQWEANVKSSSAFNITALKSEAMSNYTCGTVDYAYGDFGSALCAPKLRTLVAKYRSSMKYNEEASRTGSYTMDEDINAAYLQNTFTSGMWRILAGARYESADFTARGTKYDNGVYADNQVNTSDSHWLPALHVRRDLDNDTSIRAAWTNSLARPTFEQLSPAYTKDLDSNGTTSTVSFGNPNLKTAQSQNFDLGIERRLGFAGVGSAYIFHKKIKDFAYATNLAGSPAYPTSSYSSVATFDNGDKATLSGIELNFSRSFKELPGAWSGLLFAANATLTHSSAHIAGYSTTTQQYASRNLALPSQSDLTLNMMLGYERGPWSLRLAANHKSPYLLAVTDIGSSNGDQYVDKQTQWDFSAKYALSKTVQVYFDAINLTNEKYYVYQGTKDHNAQYESYGRTFKLGLKAALF